MKKLYIIALAVFLVMVGALTTVSVKLYHAYTDNQSWVAWFDEQTEIANQEAAEAQAIMQAEAEAEAELLALREQTKETLLELIDQLPLQVEDISLASEQIFGSANAVFLYGTDIDVFATEENNATVIMTIYLDSSTRTQMAYWDVDISIIDFTTNTEIWLEYYHYDEFLREDFYSEYWIGNYMQLVEDLKSLTISDYRDIFSELGYMEVANNE